MQHGMELLGKTSPFNIIFLILNSFLNLSNYLKPYAGGSCNSNSDCLNTNAICQWTPLQNQYLCVCPSGTYFSLITSSCASYIQIGQICTDSSQCIANATCLYQSATADYRCQCISSTYYASSTSSCLLLNTYYSVCTSSSQCQASYGLFCISGYCQCGSNYFWNGN